MFRRSSASLRACCARRRGSGGHRGRAGRPAAARHAQELLDGLPA